jgi:hypothetical protein
MDDKRHGAALFKHGQGSSGTINRALQRAPVEINRNLMHFPLARDARAKVDWFQGVKTGRRMADLPGEKTVLNRQCAG